MATPTTPVATQEVELRLVPSATPIVIDLGKKKKKFIKDLKRGQGKLMAEVMAAINEVRIGLGEEANNQQVAPVVLIYKQKRKRRKGGRNMWFPWV